MRSKIVLQRSRHIEKPCDFVGIPKPKRRTPSVQYPGYPLAETSSSYVLQPKDDAKDESEIQYIQRTFCPKYIFAQLA